MRLFGKIFVGHLAAVLAAWSVLAVAVEFISPEFYNQHIDTTLHEEGHADPVLRSELAVGHQRIMLLALLYSLPVSALLAAVTAFLSTRRIAHAISEVVGESHEIAHGNYHCRVRVRGNDEVADLAIHFNRMAEALERTEDERVEMVGTVAHELRTPLAALQGYTEALLDGVMPPEKAAHAIAREVKSMKRVASDLLLVARVESGRLEVNVQELAVTSVIDDAYERFVQAFEDQVIRLETEVAQGCPPFRADRIRLGQVVGNLLTNALRHAPRGSRVLLSASCTEDEIRIAVADQGPGIPEEHRPHVFRRFYRGEAIRSRHRGGIGIGLTVAKGMVEAMGGRIWFECRPDGTTFIVAFPSPGGPHRERPPRGGRNSTPGSLSEIA